MGRKWRGVSGLAQHVGLDDRDAGVAGEEPVGLNAGHSASSELRAVARPDTA